MLRLDRSQRNENQSNNEILLLTHQKADTNKEVTMLWEWGNRYSHQLLMEMRTVVVFWEHNLETSIKNKNTGFPSGVVTENLPANAGDTGSSPGPGRCHTPQSN